MMGLRWLKLRSEQRRGDGLTVISILSAQANLQGARYCAFGLARIGTLMFSTVAIPGVQR